MKAVIVDLNGNDAVALRDDGQFVKLKNYNYNIGQEITLQAQTRQFTRQAAIAASAAAVLFAGGGFGAYTWNNPVSYVSLDINPSIEYSLNAFDRVIAVTGMNEEGAAVVDAMGKSLRNVDITTALSITVEQLSVDAYLDTENTNYMVIGVYSDKTSKADSLKSTVDSFVPESTEVCSIATVNVTKEIKATADSYGITGGKMELITEIASASSDPASVDPASLADLTVAELEHTREQAAAEANANIAVASETESGTPDDDSETVVSASKNSEKSDAADGTSDKNTEQSSISKGDDAAEPSVTSPVAVDAAADKQPSDSADSSDAADNSSHKKDDVQNTSDSHGNGTSDKKHDDKDQTEPADTDDTDSDSNTADNSSDKNSDTVSSDKKDSTSSDKKDSHSSDKKNNSSDKTNAENKSESIEEITAPVQAICSESEEDADDAVVIPACEQEIIYGFEII